MCLTAAGTRSSKIRVKSSVRLSKDLKKKNLKNSDNFYIMHKVKQKI